MSDPVVVALIGGAVTVIGLLDRRGHKEINRQFAEIRITLNGNLERLLKAERIIGVEEGRNQKA
jgi:hypothetical protein